MGRIRTIKPEFPQSESMGRISREARLLFIQLFTIVDDSGRARASSRLLASLLYPYDSDAPELIDTWLSELNNEGCVTLYDADGNKYLQITNWLKHQKIDKPSPSKIPPFDESSRLLASPRGDLAPDLGSRILDLGSRTVDMDQDLNPPTPQGEEPLLPGIDLTAWNDFNEYRKSTAALRKNWSPLAKRKAQELLAKHLPSEQQAMVDTSIRSGWTGLFTEKGKTHETRQHVDNSVPARIRRANERRERERQSGERTIDGEWTD